MDTMTRAEIYKKIPIQGTERFLKFLEDGEIDKAAVEGAIKKGLIGKPYQTYSSANHAAYIFINLIRFSKKWGGKEKDMSISDGDSPQEKWVCYKGYWLMGIRIKKKKGRNHRTWLSSWCDWSISDIEFIYPAAADLGDLVKSFSILDERKEAEAAKKRSEKDRLYELYKGLVSQYPPGTHSWKIDQDLKAIAKEAWSFYDRFEKERKEAC